MILIYSDTSTKRLQYICKFIFKEQLGISYSLTIDGEGFKNHEGPKIKYSNSENGTSLFTISPYTLLFEKDIKEQRIDCFEENGYKAFFRCATGDYPFDILAACFYLISRYEEYLPHKKDAYDRYAHENSLAFREGFLNIPLVNIWLLDFLKKLLAVFPSIQFQLPAFEFRPTYDIDIAWAYKSKGMFRNIGGFIKKPSIQRLSVMTGLKKDPFHSYDFMHSLHQQKGLDPVYFFLVALSKSIYDKNISPFAAPMRLLIKEHAKKYDIGLHPSWKSNANPALLKKEKKTLDSIANIYVKKSRQHYISFLLPHTMERLTEAGIENDYSMGYGSINGFRASVASPFYWYNLKKEAAGRLKMHPFCFMDANSLYEQKLSPELAYDELVYYYDQCKKINGTFITIFHNDILGTAKQFSGWKEMYSKFIAQLP